jgi:hypothetical protein
MPSVGALGFVETFLANWSITTCVSYHHLFRFSSGQTGTIQTIAQDFYVVN